MEERIRSMMKNKYLPMVFVSLVLFVAIGMMVMSSNERDNKSLLKRAER